MGTYLRAVQGDREKALHLYTWNTAISATLCSTLWVYVREGSDGTEPDRLPIIALENALGGHLKHLKHRKYIPQSSVVAKGC